MDHGEDIRDGDVDLFAGGGLGTDAYGGSTKNGSDVVRLLDPGLGAPGDVVTVGENGSTESTSIVSTLADHHETENDNDK